MDVLRKLELKLPPVVIWLLLATIMYLIGKLTLGLAIPRTIRVSSSLLLTITGILVAASGVQAFLRQKTTINPHRPERSNTLVTSGVYRFTRNPMYLGLLLCLFAWAAFLSNLYSTITALAFVPVMNQLQIKPEERILREKFGDVFEKYRRQVRRWI